MIDNVRKHLASWKKNNLSMDGRATLIKSCAKAMLFYTISAFKLYNKINKDVDPIKVKFLEANEQ